MEQAIDSSETQKTILVVAEKQEDLDFTSEFLRKEGFFVLTARNGEAGLVRSRAFHGEIHLLLSDFQMADMNGLGLAAQISLERPSLKVLLMSEFRGGLLILNEGWHFLPKPFVSSQLTALVLTLICPGRSPKFKSPGVATFEV